MDQPGPGLQAVSEKSPPTIEFSTAGHPLTRLRDGILFLLCWAMWTVVLTAVVNSTEWEAVAISTANWIGAHLAFVSVLLTAFHFPAGYASMLIILVCAFMIWSNLGTLFAMRRSAHADIDAERRQAVLSLEDLVRHFGLDSAMIGAMQKEAQVIVFHAPCGAVTAVRRASVDIDAASLRLVV